MGDPELEQPLLQGAAATANAAAAPDGAAAAADAAEAGAGGAPLSVASLRSEAPERALELLARRGAVDLGAVAVQDAALKQALGSDGDDLLTAAADAPPGAGFDAARFWAPRLPAPNAGSPGARKQAGWASSVEALARVVAVEGATAPGAEGLVHLACSRFQITGDAAIFTIPVVEAVITYKWNAFARRALQAQLAFYFGWLLSFTAFTWLFQDEDLTLSLPDLLASPRGTATVALQLAALGAMIPFLLQELRLIAAYGLRRWAGLWNTLDSSAYVLQIAISAVHLQRSQVASPAFSIVLAAQCLLLYTKVQYYSRVLQSANTSFVDTLRAVLADSGVFYLLLFLGLSFYSFAAAFHILFRLDQKEVEEFNSFLHTTGTIFAFATGGPDFGLLWKSSVPVAASLLCFVYNFVLAIVLLNLLIAVMSDSYGRIMEREEGRFRAAQAQMIDELEVTLPPWLYATLLARVPTAAIAPRCVHFLQRSEDSGGGGGDEGAASVSELRDRLASLEAALAGLESRLGAKLDALAPASKGGWRR
ncbi:hypothetical protein Rsub_06728 [Raphidocelis subcapitata]|uniref:Ion transport domain-containing protein n=1 Tax=Raphidocelis subcapitata TaxID=307507 RepID=A0A2V0P9N6_9CHLO|nr:hypothetical protein Rsub_06728 [Raphidocelis subcapitata]|eukprot:GBF94613.1 hypothetical protein Rsub_06728 [Raphidocelis subcapitata]